EDISVCQIQNARPAVLAGSVPSRAGQLPADLKGHLGLAGSRGHGKQYSALPLQNGLYSAVYGNLLVVPERGARLVILRRQEARFHISRYALCAFKALPQIVGGRESRYT